MIRFWIVDFAFRVPRIRRRAAFVFALATLFFALCSTAEAQHPTRIIKIGELLFRDRTTLGPGRQVFRGQLRKLGYVEGENVFYETRSAKGQLERFPALAEELVQLKVDVLFASSTNEALAFKRVTRTKPIVFHITSDPIAD